MDIKERRNELKVGKSCTLDMLNVHINVKYAKNSRLAHLGISENKTNTLPIQVTYNSTNHSSNATPKPSSLP